MGVAQESERLFGNKTITLTEEIRESTFTGEISEPNVKPNLQLLTDLLGPGDTGKYPPAGG